MTAKKNNKPTWSGNRVRDRETYRIKGASVGYVYLCAGTWSAVAFNQYIGSFAQPWRARQAVIAAHADRVRGCG